MSSIENLKAESHDECNPTFSESAIRIFLDDIFFVLIQNSTVFFTADALCPREN